MFKLFYNLIETMTPTKIQEQFMWLAHAEGKTFDEISKLLNVPRETISQWEIELRPLWQKIAEIKKIHTQKADELPFKDFYNWYLQHEQNKCCVYCGITEKQIEILFSKDDKLTKRNRGKKLELDRKSPNLPYDDTKNIVWACYWCNNAKTDTFSFEEFKIIGKTISEIWDKRLNQ